jgi:hypothetical protein
MIFLGLRMAATVVASLALAFQIHAQETKKVCHAEKDRKGKEVKVCRDVRVHKKLDATPIPKK